MFIFLTILFPLKCFSSLSFISFAALLVKVTAVISLGSIFIFSIRNATLDTRVFVFPVPGPAITSTALSVDEVAFHCSSFNP